MSVCYNKLYYDKLCPALTNGGLRIAARLRLMLVFVVVTRWLRYLFVFFVLSRMLVLLLMKIKRSEIFFKKKGAARPNKIITTSKILIP
jgi:uncharacterized membrane protein